jgi:hypothetical protein
MKTITLEVPDEEIKALHKFLLKSNITVIDEMEDDFEVEIFEIVLEEEDIYLINQPGWQQLENELEDEIWRLHHFVE